MEQELKDNDSGKGNEKCEKDENEQEKNEAEESDSDKDGSEDADENDDEETEDKDDDKTEDDETEYKDIDEKEEEIEKQDQHVNENPSENLRNEFEDGRNKGQDKMFCEFLQDKDSLKESDHKAALKMEDTGKEYIGEDVLKNNARQDKICHQEHSEIVPNESEADTVSLASEVDLSVTIDMQNPSDKKTSMAWVTESKVTSTDEVAMTGILIIQ